MKLNSYKEILEAAENGTLISFKNYYWGRFYNFMIKKLDTSFKKEWSKLDPRFVLRQNSLEKNKVFKEQLKYVEQVHFDEFLKPLSNLRQHLLWCFDFDESLTSFPEIMDAAAKQAVICPSPRFWAGFCSFIDDNVTIGFWNYEMRPFILDTWYSTNDFQKNQQFQTHRANLSPLKECVRYVTRLAYHIINYSKFKNTKTSTFAQHTIIIFRI